MPLTFRQDRRVYLGEEAIRIDVLGRTDPADAGQQQDDKQVFLRGDGARDVQELMDVMDA